MHKTVKENGLGDRIIKNDLKDLSNIEGKSGVLDYYLIFLGYNVNMGGKNWLNDRHDLIK